MAELSRPSRSRWPRRICIDHRNKPGDDELDGFPADSHRKDFWAGADADRDRRARDGDCARLSVRHRAAHGAGLFPDRAGRRSWCCSASIWLANGLRSGERSKANWSLRALIVLPLSLVLFGVLMDRAGFVPALVVLIFGSAAAGTEFRLVEVVLLTVVLTAFSVAVFIWGLGLPYPLLVGLLSGRHGPVQQSDLRLRRRVLAAEPALLLHRRAGRHADRRAAGHRPARHHRDAAAAHLQRPAGRPR